MAVPHTGTPTTAVLSDAAVDDLTANTIVTPNLTATTGKIVTARFGGEPWFDVKAPAYAAVGDGVNDDTAEIQAAIDAAKLVGGGTVYFPSGTYKISAPLILHSGVTLLGNGRRNSVILVSVINVNAIEARGASAASTIVQINISDLKIVGPGKAAGGTGVGIYVKWASVQVSLERLWVTTWGSHGVSFEDSYSFSLRDCNLDSNGGNGFYGITNINHATFDHCQAGLNTGAGFYISGGATTSFVNCDAEQNTAAGVDLRYVTAGSLLNCHFEKNGSNGTSPNIYLHQRAAGEPATMTTIRGCLIQGQGVTVYGIQVDAATGTEIEGNWFANQVTDHVNITANASRTKIGSNVYSGTGTQLTSASVSTARLEYDSTNLMQSIGPGLLFQPQAANPAVLAEGELWFLDSTDNLTLRAGARTRTVFSGLGASASLDFPSIAANSSTTLNITVAGAVIGDKVIMGPPSLPIGLIPVAGVIAADVVTIRMFNVTAAAIDPAVGTWTVAVVK